MPETFKIEVVYALPEKQELLTIEVDSEMTAYDAVEASGLLKTYPKILDNPQKMPLTLGLWGKILRTPKSYYLQPGDRIEIYRPLSIDPKELRRRRAQAGQS